MTIFEAMHFFRQLGTTWYDQRLDQAPRTPERCAQFREGIVNLVTELNNVLK